MLALHTPQFDHVNLDGQIVVFIYQFFLATGDLTILTVHRNNFTNEKKTCVMILNIWSKNVQGTSVSTLGDTLSRHFVNCYKCMVCSVQTSDPTEQRRTVFFFQKIFTWRWRRNHIFHLKLGKGCYHQSVINKRTSKGITTVQERFGRACLHSIRENANVKVLLLMAGCVHEHSELQTFCLCLQVITPTSTVLSMIISGEFGELRILSKLT